MIKSFDDPGTRFLSNSYPFDRDGEASGPEASLVEYRGVVYRCVETAFQAAKCSRPEDRERFAGLGPRAARNLAESGSVDIRKDWNQMKVGIMEELVWNKFWCNLELRILLLETGSEEIVAGDDDFWGSGKGNSENVLGRILMDVRRDVSVAEARFRSPSRD